MENTNTTTTTIQKEPAFKCAACGKVKPGSERIQTQEGPTCDACRGAWEREGEIDELLAQFREAQRNERGSAFREEPYSGVMARLFPGRGYVR